MNVYKLFLSGEHEYGCGLAIIAAKNEEEAYAIAKASDTHNGKYLSDNLVTRGDLEKIEGLTWAGEPCVICHETYFE